MKKTALFALALLASEASASDAAVVLNLTDGIDFGVTTLTSLELDVTFHRSYMGINGAFKSGGLGVPTSGTCQSNSSGGVFCLLQSGHVSFILELAQNLSGTVRFVDEFGGVDDISAVTLKTVL